MYVWYRIQRFPFTAAPHAGGVIVQRITNAGLSSPTPFAAAPPDFPFLICGTKSTGMSQRIPAAYILRNQ